MRPRPIPVGKARKASLRRPKVGFGRLKAGNLRFAEAARERLRLHRSGEARLGRFDYQRALHEAGLDEAVRRRAKEFERIQRQGERMAENERLEAHGL